MDQFKALRIILGISALIVLLEAKHNGRNRDSDNNDENENGATENKKENIDDKSTELEDKEQGEVEKVKNCKQEGMECKIGQCCKDMRCMGYIGSGVRVCSRGNGKYTGVIEQETCVKEGQWCRIGECCSGMRCVPMLVYGLRICSTKDGKVKKGELEKEDCVPEYGWCQPNDCCKPDLMCDTRLKVTAAQICKKLVFKNGKYQLPELPKWQSPSPSSSSAQTCWHYGQRCGRRTAGGDLDCCKGMRCETWIDECRYINSN